MDSFVEIQPTDLKKKLQITRSVSCLFRKEVFNTLESFLFGGKLWNKSHMKIFCEMILQKQVIRSYQFLLYDRHRTLEKNWCLKIQYLKGRQYTVFLCRGLSLIYTNLFQFHCVENCSLFNHPRIRSWDQPVLSKENQWDYFCKGNAGTYY